MLAAPLADRCAAQRLRSFGRPGFKLPGNAHQYLFGLAAVQAGQRDRGLAGVLGPAPDRGHRPRPAGDRLASGFGVGQAREQAPPVVDQPYRTRRQLATLRGLSLQPMPVRGKNRGKPMAFHSLMMQLVADLCPLLPKAPSVVELGNQTFKPGAGDIERVAGMLTSQLSPFDAALLKDIEARSGDGLSASTADYYRALGFASYRTIDVNARYNSLLMDLNRDLAEHYGFRETFDLVTNNGTGEHVFNQSAVFANTHALCEVGGVMLHVLPFFNYLNHGFFNFNPILFHDLAAANRYQVCRLSIANNHGLEIGDRLQPDGGSPALSRAHLQERCAVDGSTRGSLLHLLGIGTARKRGHRPLSTALRRVMTQGPNVSVVAALRKTIDQPFQFPIQGMYSGANIADPELREVYEHSVGVHE